jgi:hypothetical protein
MRADGENRPLDKRAALNENTVRTREEEQPAHPVSTCTVKCGWQVVKAKSTQGERTDETLITHLRVAMTPDELEDTGV